MLFGTGVPKPFCFPERFFWNPLGKRGRLNPMLAGRRMYLTNRCQLLAPEPMCQPDQSRPQLFMDVSHLSMDKPAHQYVGRLANHARTIENLMRLGMRPPTATNWLASNRLRQTRNGTPPGLQQDPVGFH